MAAIVGRQSELGVLRDFVTSIADGATALVLDGEAGAGKSCLFDAGLAEADARGFRVLVTRPAESEISLSFSGLRDVLDTVLPDALDPLPDTQKRALARALLLDDADERLAPDPYAVGVALLNGLRALAEVEPLVIAVDDVQWLDAASASALMYAARRLRSERVGALLARRASLDSALPDELRHSLGPRFASIDVGPFDAVTLQRIVERHLGIALPRPILNDVHELSGGNPLFALEVVRTLRRSGRSIDAGQPLQVPRALHELVHGRVAALPADSREFLLAAAAHAQPTIALTEAASGVGRRAGLTPALEADIVEVESGRIRFTHPLLAAATYESADPARRSEIHARLAELLEDPEARAVQLAAAVEEPDEAVAVLVEEGAIQARARGAPRAAAVLLGRACELTPLDHSENALRRGIDAAYLHYESGDSQTAEASLRELIDPLPPGGKRARALVVLARIQTYDAAAATAVDTFLQAVEESGEDLQTLAVAHEGVASCLLWQMERLPEVVHHARVAFDLAREVGDEAIAADVLIAQLGAAALLGSETAPALAKAALTSDANALDRRVLDQPLIGVSEYWMWTDAHDRSRETLLDLLRRAQELGDESSRSYLLFLLGEVESMLGDLESALARAREGREAAEQSGQSLFAAYCLALEGLALAQLGRPEEARDAVARALTLGHEGGGQVRLVASSALGHLELALQNPDVALAALKPALEFVLRESILEPGATPFVVDYVETLVALGRLDEAREHLGRHEAHALRLQRCSALAATARCRGLLAAAEGNLDDARASYAVALAWHEQAELPVDRGRTLLALGVAQRRSKRRRDARSTLEDALGVFERIGAALWADRARAELRRISGRAASPETLTPAEERVAALVLEGRSNREVAAALSLSDRTVEGHLSRVFRKLGVRRRSELAGALAARQRQEPDASNTGGMPVSSQPLAP